MARSRGDMEERIQERIQSDPEFREALRNDPKGALQQTFGIHLPPNVTINVVEDTVDTHYIVLPEQTSGQVLSDEALESVAGGGPFNW